MLKFVDICTTSDVPVGEARVFGIEDRRYGIFNVNGEFFAIDDHCPHAGASLSRGIIECEVVRCRIHHWRFCIRNGTYLDETKPQFNVGSYQVRIVGEQVQIGLEDSLLQHRALKQDPEES